MNISIVIFFLLVAIGAYFVVKGFAAGFCGVIVTAAIAVAIVHNIDTFTSLGLKTGLKTGTVDVSVEVARVRDEIFAKAEEVQQLAEQSAAISAWVVSTANRLVGESFQEQLLQRRAELLAMLIDLDVAPERRIAIVMPITRAVANDYRMNILSEARHAVVDAISGTKQQVDAIIREIVAPLENPDQQTGLLELRRHAEQHNLKLEGFHSAVDRYDRFLEQNPDLVE